MLFVHARLQDKDDMLCIQESSVVEFEVKGATLVGPGTVEAEAGIASIVVRVPAQTDGFTVSARAGSVAGLNPAQRRWWARP